MTRLSDDRPQAPPQTEVAVAGHVMDGIGNRILVLDLRGVPGILGAEEAARLAALPTVDADQLMLLHAPTIADTHAAVTIRNRDGSPAGACGNGARCVAHVLGEEAPRQTRLPFSVDGRRLDAWRSGAGHYGVDMGAPRFAWADIPLASPVEDTRCVPLDAHALDPRLPSTFAAANMGNPHGTWVVPDPDAFDLTRIGPRLERHPLFPERANIGLLGVVAPDRLVLRVWERGAGATLACGSAACAALVNAHRLGLAARTAKVVLPGGTLRLSWRVEDGHVLMEGPVAHHGRLTFTVRLDGAP